MKNIFLILVFISSIVYADNEPNNNCSTQAEIIEQLEGATELTDRKESGWVHKSRDRYDIYKFTVASKGTLKITSRGKNTNYSFFIGTSCSKYKDIYSNTENKTKKDAPEFEVDSGQTIYLTLQRRYDKWMSYDIDIRFDPIEEVEPPTPTDNKFKLKYITSLKGNLKVIGNTVLYGSQTSDNSNSQVTLDYIDVDSDSQTFNSSKAKITAIEAGVNVEEGKIIWAGLYWQGYMHNNDNDTGIDNQFDFHNGKDDKNAMLATINNQIVKVSLETGEKFEITPSEIYIDQQYEENDYIAFKYAAFTEITEQLKGLSPTNEYTLADIVTREGKTDSGNKSDGLGNYGAWTLVVVYENEDQPLEKMRNLSIFNGYEVLSKTDNPKTTITLEGFRTPEFTLNGVDSTISIFAGEGDKYILGDYAKLINENGLVYDLPNASGTSSYFASAIEGVPERTPNLKNNNGIDIHTNAVGSNHGADKPIKENQTKAYLEMKSTQDTYMPSMVAFATELFTPKLCYDYSIALGEDIKVPSEGRQIDTSSYGKELSMKVLVRSEEGDFTFSNATISLEFTPEDSTQADDQLTYKIGSSLVSPPFINTYINVPDLSADGEVAIGKLNADKTFGDIDSKESSYLKQKYLFDNNSFKGKFDIRLKGKIKFDGVDRPVQYDLTTKDGTGRLEECQTNKAYSPVWGEYNIERIDSYPSPIRLPLPIIPDSSKYPLYTQVVGRDFSLALRSYAYNESTQQYDVGNPISSMIEIELIDAGLFDNDIYAGYDSSCEEPDRIGGSSYLKIGTPSIPSFSRTINIPQDITNFENDRALKNVAFRMWFLGAFGEDDIFRVIQHQCMPNVDSTCFKDLYKDNYGYTDTTGICQIDCSTNYNTSSCYNCLKINFAKPICSRDNFSIKPETFRVKISDNKEGTEVAEELITNNTKENIKFAAGYNYYLDIESKANKSEVLAKGYFKNDFKEDKIEDLEDIEEYIGLKSKNKETCFDKNNYTYNYTFVDGKIYENSLFKHINSGEYDFLILDSKWTEVDQSDYEYKNLFSGIKTNDCILDQALTSGDYTNKTGCNISSDVDETHNLIDIMFYPYSFSFEDIDFNTVPSGKTKIFMNDFSFNIYESTPIFMGALIDGYLVAIEKGGSITTNFTENCYSKNVSLDILRTTEPTTEENLISKKGFGVTKTVEFQQYLDMDYAEDHLVLGMDEKIVLDREEFRIEDPGKAKINLYMTFKKSIDSVIPPIRAVFEKLIASSTDSNSSAEKEKDFTPTKEETYDKEIDYFFGKVTPYRKLYGPTIENKANTPVYVDVYCEDRIGLSCAEFGLFNHTKGKDDNFLTWYNAQDIFSNSDFGNIDLGIKTILGKNASPSVKDIIQNKSKSVLFDDPFAAQEDIQVKLSGEDRPSVVEIEITPSPWLIYDEYNILGNPTYRVKFIGDSVWTGVGNTGQVINSDANMVTNRRMKW